MAAQFGSYVNPLVIMLTDTSTTASDVRLRPIVMTGVTTAAGAETRIVFGVVVLCGVLAATVFTLFVVPVDYSLLARRSSTPARARRRLERELGATGRPAAPGLPQAPGS